MHTQHDVYQSRDRRAWTEEEDEMLRLAIEIEDPNAHPPTRWHAISQHIPHRTNKDCRKRWWAQMASSVSKGCWTGDEDERLCNAVAELGHKWALVANRVGTRNSGQCAKRWNDALNPSIDRSRWSHEEDERLLKAVSELGHSWATIARTLLPGRTGLAVKNRYNHLIRGASRNAEKSGHQVSSVSKRRSRNFSVSSSSAASTTSSTESLDEHMLSYSPDSLTTIVSSGSYEMHASYDVARGAMPGEHWMDSSIHEADIAIYSPTPLPASDFVGHPSRSHISDSLYEQSHANASASAWMFYEQHPTSALYPCAASEPLGTMGTPLDQPMQSPHVLMPGMYVPMTHTTTDQAYGYETPHYHHSGLSGTLSEPTSPSAHGLAIPNQWSAWIPPAHSYCYTP
ncbi:uncharacterized protein LAESUDRAFT_757439 [Laetiporus sulphureus 93-53]|uniref:Homeodomain-like protein n=1 Tax=Laetiporus sulphureus 93-53 TaxID=1314785 RepID=A0A165FBN9_9APHY|nr:uncharacterized protein LAESUDRAFT_757439 [Laetiporus sulphureus 93-53]KZT08724.1 hypothetical protein LAESUDRAFT_757439 [Laetiporus sulphureus 93-53]